MAALQSRVGRILLARLPAKQREAVLGKEVGGSRGGGGGGRGGAEKYKSIVVAGPRKSWVNSDACLRIGRELRGPLRYLALLAHLVPRIIRDMVYTFLSGQRTRIFGKAAECRLWDDNWDTRFVDDSLFGGRSGQGQADIFADPSIVAATVDDHCEDDTDDMALWDKLASPGLPSLRVGDVVRVVSPRPILHSNIPGLDGGVDVVCSVGMTGTVTRVLDRRSYPHPKNVAVRFELARGDGVDHHVGREEGATTIFEAKFLPSQLRKEQE